MTSDGPTREEQAEPGSGTAQRVSPGFSPVDAGITAGLLALTVAVSVTAALHLRRETDALEREARAGLGRATQTRAILEHLEARHTTLKRLRKESRRYQAEVEARGIVPWATVVGELSRRRPGGVWTTHVSGEGPRFRARIATAREDLADLYAQRLRESPYVEFAGLPAGERPSRQTQIIGRWMGD